MSFRPASLIQVHYHNRLSGVNKVARLYAEAFHRLAGNRNGASLVVCGQSKGFGADFHPAKIVPAPLCDYREFSSKKQFERVKESLARSISKAIKSKKVKAPICVIGHNLTIGKNCALSAAFAEIAGRHAGRRADVRFFSVIHDFAEEGRLDCLKRIERVKKWSDIENDLFPVDNSVRFITLNAGNAAILKKAGFIAAALGNPVPQAGNSILRRNDPLKGISYFDNDLPTLLYPSRCISRKNILEAILLCNFVIKSNLMIGASGTTANDTAVFKKTSALCKRYRLPVMLDYGGKIAGIMEKGPFTNKAFDFADACVTTSIAEGFGYGLFEPWMHGMSVFGRKYLGFSPFAGVRFNSLYDRVPIPMTWVSIKELRNKYWTAMNKCFGVIGNNSLLSNKKQFDRGFDRYFIQNETIDFGALDAAMQFKIIESLIKSPDKTADWEIACKDQLSTIRNFADTAICKSEKIIQYNQDRINKHLSLDSFSKEFKNVLSQPPKRNPQPGSREKILREFCTFERFRLLLAG